MDLLIGALVVGVIDLALIAIYLFNEIKALRKTNEYIVSNMTILIKEHNQKILNDAKHTPLEDYNFDDSGH